MMELENGFIFNQETLKKDYGNKIYGFTKFYSNLKNQIVYQWKIKQNFDLFDHEFNSLNDLMIELKTESCINDKDYRFIMIFLKESFMHGVK